MIWVCLALFPFSFLLRQWETNEGNRGWRSCGPASHQWTEKRIWNDIQWFLHGADRHRYEGQGGEMWNKDTYWNKELHCV